MDTEIVKQAAEIALRLAALPAGDLRDNPKFLDSIEQLAMRVLKEVSALRTPKPLQGETRGMWPAMKPLQRQ